MFRPTRRVTGEGWFRVFGVALLATTAAVLWIAQPVAANAEKISIVLQDGKKMEIEFDQSLVNIVATVDGKKLPVSERVSYPVPLGKNTRKIVGIYPGPVPVVVFEGNSNCYFIGGRWIGVPAGTVCP